MKYKLNEELSFGIDVGIASVGWAVIAKNRIINLGVRCFDKAEVAKTGESLNLARRSARLLRRRLRRRAWRLTKLARLLKREGLIADVNVLKQQPSKGFITPHLWSLRVEGLDRLLTSEEWARVIYHLCKHRGFHWVSRAEEAKADGDGETGKVKKGLSDTKRRMTEKNYRSAAEMVLNEFPDAQRNKQGDYSKALSRLLLNDEFRLLFKQQRAFGNPHTSVELENLILGTGDKKSGLFWAQKPSLSGEALLKMLGKCTFEKNEHRAPKASFTAERHVWLTRLNNTRIVIDGKIRALNEAERAVAMDLPYNQSSDFSYKQLRNALVKNGLSADFKFTGLSYPSERQKAEDKAKDPEEVKLVRLTGWQTLHKIFKDAGLENEWQVLSVQALDGAPELLDQIVWVLTVYKEDNEVQHELSKLELPNKEKTIDALLNVRFDKFSNLSLKALYNIVPHMIRGLRYDEACIEAGYHHSQLHTIGAGEHRYLPPFYKSRDKDGRMVFDEEKDIPRNPVVLRALNQTRKVINALIKTYGSPHSIHIEMARELSKPFDERKKIQTAQEEYRERNDKDRLAFANQFGIMGRIDGRDFEKYQLYREQQGKCAYSTQALDLHRLFEMGYAEIDHVLPYSRSFDDSKNNRVLVLARENRNKGNRTPYEYLDGKNDSPQWREFVAFVNSNKAYRQAKRNRLLKKDFDEKDAKDFSERNLNDTRYIGRFLKNYIEQHLQLHTDSTAKRCVVVSGQLTSFLRQRWGLNKIRSESDRHHAMDAVVIACCSHSMVKRLADYSRKKELEKVQQGFVDIETGEVLNPEQFARLEQHFPTPWHGFRDELIARLSIDNPEILREEIERLGTYHEYELTNLRPLFVSRAPQRRNSGAAHKETIYAQPASLKLQGGVTQKINLVDMKLSDMDSLIDPHRNEKLYAVVRTWLSQRDDKEKRAKEIEKTIRLEKRKASNEEQILLTQLRALPHKPTNNGSVGAVVRSLTKVIDKQSGIPIRGGVAKNDTMLRTDIFTKAGKFYLVPVYVHHSVAKELPNRAIVAHKPESEWTLMDDSFAFCFSLHPNDLVKVQQKGKPVIWGYYSSCHRGTGNINFWTHDRNVNVGKEGMIEGIGIKTAVSIEKFNVDVLGNIYPITQEVRNDLA